MRTATISFLGLYTANGALFDGLTIPEGVDKQTLVHNLLLETADLEVIYPDSGFMAEALRMYSTKQLVNWQKYYATSQLKYDPIYNFDRYESYTDNETTSGLEDQTDTVAGSVSGSTDSNVTSKVAGFNAAELVESGANITGATTSSENSSSGTSSREHSSTRKFEHEARLYGNIGVTTSQQMLQSEIDIIPNINIYDLIIQDIKNRFCLLVY